HRSLPARGRRVHASLRTPTGKGHAMTTGDDRPAARTLIGRRAAITWVSSTGASLLLAATAVFTAVHWNALTEVQKFGVFLGLTGIALLGGVRYRHRLPATTGAIVHLGVLLASIDAWALGRSFGVDWPGLLVMIGATEIAVAWPIERMLDSRVLRGALI